MTSGVAGVGNRKKCKRMEFCIGEALKQADQEFLRDAQSLALHRDATGETLLTRFSACDSNLRTRSGIFGIVTPSPNLNLKKK